MIESNTDTSNKINESIFIRYLLTQHLTEGNSISLWRLPNTGEKNLIICSEGLTPVDEISIEDSEPGFVLSPFNPSEQTYFLRANHTYVFRDGKLAMSSEHHDNIQATYATESGMKPEIAYHVGKPKDSIDPDKDNYLELVRKGLEKIAQGAFEKVVPARCKTINLEKSIDLFDSFNTLCDLYPNTFISLVSTPETGTWLGASPELLVQVIDNASFRTTAVAGTQWLPFRADLKSIAWTQKEIEEQALVSRYIINCFKQIRLREFEEHGPRTWQAGNLLHLKTDFKVDMNATNFPQLGSVMLKLLHPTSAICGMPRDVSIQFLATHEKFDRQYFSGFLGPVNFQNESHIYVNLRCMQWGKKQVKLFAGAGITSGSIPEKEWEETELKLNTLLQIIQK